MFSMLHASLQSETDDVPLYVAVKDVMNKAGQVEAVEINYLTFYAYNGPYKVGVPPIRPVRAGAHDGDWEHFTVRWLHCCKCCWFALHSTALLYLESIDGVFPSTYALIDWGDASIYWNHGPFETLQDT